MRLLLCCLALTACDASTEPVVVRRSAAVCVVPVDCKMIPDTSTIWLNGQKYLEIVEHCE